MDKKRLYRMFIMSVAMIIVSVFPGQADEAISADMNGPVRAVSVLHPTAGNDVNGKVLFNRKEETVAVIAEVKGLTPGKHGFHIHVLGDCSAADGTSAGGHFNPEESSHGGPGDMMRHVGDLGNLEADANGYAYYERSDSHLTLSGLHSIIGRAVIVHADADDFTSQPTGAAGSRVACGVIGIAD